MHDAVLVWTVIGVVVAAVAVFTPPGQKVIAKLSRGQSITALTTVLTAQAVGANAAYESVAAENVRLREEYEKQLAERDKEIAILKGRVDTLARVIGANEAIEALTIKVTGNHADVVGRLDDLLVLARGGK